MCNYYRGKAVCSVDGICDKGDWVYGALVPGDSPTANPYITGGIEEAGDDFIIPSFWVPVDLKTVGEFTGIYDGDNKKIYTGDIVKWDDATHGEYWRVAEVIRQPGHFTFRTIPSLCINCLKEEACDFQMGCFAYCPDTKKYGNVLKVIGNIYETPYIK